VKYREEALFFWLYIPFGLILITLGRLGEKHKPLAIASYVLTFVGWVSLFIPLIMLSWPESWFKASFPFFKMNILAAEYLVLLGIAIGLLFWLYTSEGEVRLTVACLAYGILIFFAPFGNLTILMLITHLGLLVYFFGLLYASYLHFPERRIERFLGFAFPIIMILSKGIGFLTLGYDTDEFFVAYCIGFIILGTVCLLINQSLKLLVTQKGQEFPAHILDAVCAFTGFGMLYALSFKIEDQTSVFNTSSVVLTLLGMFLIIALGLYVFLWLKSSEKLIVGLSALIFFTSAGVLAISGPGVHWILYSVIFNALLFLMTATLIYYSTQINSAKLVNLAIAGFLLQVITRYFDIFWDMFSGSILFIATGLLALVGGYFLERNRRKLLRSMEEE
jgi:hypothetical protein